MGRSPLLPVILAAGIGSRLGGQPKALFRLDGRPLLDLAAEALAASGFSRMLVVTGHRAYEVERHAAAAAYPLECLFVENDRFADLNNFHTVRVAIDAAGDRDLLILNCDVVFRQAVLAAAARAAVAPLGLVVEEGVVDAEAMKVQAVEGVVLRLSKEIPSRDAIGEFIGVSTLAGAAQSVYVEAADSALRAGETSLYYEDVYSRICGRVTARMAAVEPGTWAEVDTPADVPAAVKVARTREVAAGSASNEFASVLSAAGAR